MAPLLIRALRTLHLYPAVASAAFLLFAASPGIAQLAAPSSPSGGRASASQPDGNAVLLVERADEMLRLLVLGRFGGSPGHLSGSRVSSESILLRIREIGLFRKPCQVRLPPPPPSLAFARSAVGGVASQVASAFGLA
jgi:hypothetical protein